MPRKNAVQPDLKPADDTAREVRDLLIAGWDPRRAIAHLNAEVVAFQRAGADLPAELMRLTRAIAGGEGAYSQRHSAG